MKKTVMVVLFFFAMAGVSHAQIFNVGTLGELQSALALAISNGQDDTINIAAGTIAVDSQLLYETNENYSMTIRGAGSGATILHGGGTTQIMTINISPDDPKEITIEGITFQNSLQESGPGGGLYVYNGNGGVTIRDCAFVNNLINAYEDGGGAYIEASADISISGCSFIGNECVDEGGGLYAMAGDTITVVNSVFRDNTTTDEGYYGGGLFIYSYDQTGDVYVINNTITGNTSDGWGGGLVVDDSNASESAKTFNIYNNIIWGNTSLRQPASNDMYIFNQYENTVVNLYNNDIGPYELSNSEGTLNTGANINNDPLIDGTSHLTSGSPCINVGTNSAPRLPSRDFEDEARIMGGTVDMGADEYAVGGSASIPTLSEWGIIIMSLILSGSALWMIRRRQTA